MYLPRSFEEKRPEVLLEFLRTHPFATLVVQTADGPEAAHIPFEWRPGPGPFGSLQGHLARANPLWCDADTHFEALVLFQGPHAYISPAWYPGRHTHGKEVPTWDYVVVHAHGPLHVIDDPAWLRAQVEQLTDHHEAGRPDPWKVAEAPAEYTDKELRHIIGVEIPLTRLEGKWKASQNRAMADRRGVVAGLCREGGPAEKAMAEVVQQFVEPERD